MRRAVTVKRAIERRVANPLSRRILVGEFKEGETAIGLRRCRVRLRQEGSAPQARESGGAGRLVGAAHERKERAVAAGDRPSRYPVRTDPSATEARSHTSYSACRRRLACWNSSGYLLAARGNDGPGTTSLAAEVRGACAVISRSSM